MQNRLFQFNRNGDCIGLNLHTIREWAKHTIPHHSHFYPARQTRVLTKQAYYDELREQSRNIDPFTWIGDLGRALNYLTIITNIIIERDGESFCDHRPHQSGEQCPNRIGIIFPEPPQQAIN